MTENELKTALNKLFKMTVPKKFGEKFSDIEVVDLDYTPDVDDISDEGEWVSGDVYEITVSIPELDDWKDLKKIESYLTDLIQSMIGKSNWISIHFV